MPASGKPIQPQVNNLTSCLEKAADFGTFADAEIAIAIGIAIEIEIEIEIDSDPDSDGDPVSDSDGDPDPDSDPDSDYHTPNMQGWFRWWDVYVMPLRCVRVPWNYPAKQAFKPNVSKNVPKQR
jgi:hypothetical protein